jgi:hypothetical protein
MTWKIGDCWITFGDKRRVGTAGDKLASKENCRNDKPEPKTAPVKKEVRK